MERTPLDLAALSEAARKAVSGPGPFKLMAARGLAPLPRPADLVSVLYQLSLDPDAVVKDAADKTASELPDKVLAGALADTGLDARVLDWFVGKVLTRPGLLEAVLLNKNTADETVREWAGKLGEREVEIVAGNEERLLRCPAIIGALYMNPKARMSTVDRMVELAVRNNVAVPGIPAWDDIVAAVLGLAKEGTPMPPPAQEDAAFAAAAAFAVGETEPVPVSDEELDAFFTEEEAAFHTPEATDKQSKISQLSIPGKIRLATLGNAFARALLIRDSNKQVALAAIRSPGVTDNEAVKFSANRALCDDVVRVIANSKDWTKIYAVKLNLVNNPKCPLQTAMRFLPYLHEKDVRALAKSKGVPTAIATQARKLVQLKSESK